MIKDVLQAKDYIKHIRIENNAWFIQKMNIVNCYLMNTDRQRLTLQSDFLFLFIIEIIDKFIRHKFNKNNTI